MNDEALAKSYKTGFSTHHLIISDRVPNYHALNAVIDSKRLTILFKTRFGLLKLKGEPELNQDDKICDFCNTGEIENVFHLIAICPQLRSLLTI